MCGRPEVGPRLVNKAGREEASAAQGAEAVGQPSRGPSLSVGVWAPTS